MARTLVYAAPVKNAIQPIATLTIVGEQADVANGLKR